MTKGDLNIMATETLKNIANRLDITESKNTNNLDKSLFVEGNVHELEAMPKIAIEPEMQKESTLEHVAKFLKETADFNTEFVIDASISGIKGLRSMISFFLAKNARIILTSITINELERMQKFHTIAAVDARYLLSTAAKNPNSFYTVLIDETLETPDDCIIKYCADHKDKVTLLTADKTMTLKARMYGVQAQYFEHEKSTNFATKPMIAQQSHSKTCTLYVARKVGNKLYISNFNNHYRSVMLLSEGFEYTDGVRELKIGDDVYLATKKLDYLTFAHYRIISLSAENNCKLIYSARIRNVHNLSKLPAARYKSFMRDFKCRHDL